ncbi:hypothetical protein O181_000624 [Austropuccinia psidii MF-1]|uniref:Uncharacterized protein n=1 Tax=Austropuccinia psidii MF-1 TaxID=1389203 RepID=A0A9Q3B8V7_9BASI|nr:hypothetical protein [Austropuccinia psidii MF-1]
MDEPRDLRLLRRSGWRIALNNHQIRPDFGFVGQGQEAKRNPTEESRCFSCEGQLKLSHSDHAKGVFGASCCIVRTELHHIARIAHQLSLFMRRNMAQPSADSRSPLETTQISSDSAPVKSLDPVQNSNLVQGYRALTQSCQWAPKGTSYNNS